MIRAQFAHGQKSVQGLPLSGCFALAPFVWPCEVRARIFLRPRSRLERDCCSQLEPFWRVRVFFLRWRCMLRTDVAGCLTPFAGALPRPTLISRPIRRTNRCVNLYGSTKLKFVKKKKKIVSNVPSRTTTCRVHSAQCTYRPVIKYNAICSPNPLIKVHYRTMVVEDQIGDEI